MEQFRRIWAAAAICAGLCSGPDVFAVSLWTEDAENGLAYVIDNTDPSYPLIQSDVVGQGDYAFHLAHPAAQDNWFTIDQTLTIQPDTKLFFLSRLRSATTSQFARVQISTNAGSSWPINVYSQAGSGSGSGGEGAFTLKEVNLASYANQNLRFRFYYDLVPPGSYFPQTTSTVGWFVDDVQIGSEFEKIQWSIGDPTPHAQLYLEYINRARADALVEAQRLRNETDADVQDAYSFFGIDGQDIVDQFTWYVDNGAMARFAQPLSFQPNLLMAAELHTQDMFQNQFQGHNSSNNPPAPFQPGFTLGQRLDAVGYDGAAGENVYASADSVVHGHTGFDVDWGNTSNPASPWYNPAFDGQGMQNPAGHRRNLHNGDFKEIGIGVINGPSGSFGPQYVTQDLGNPGDVRYVTGAVYEDLNSNSFYDVGEGRSGVRIDVAGSPFFGLSTTSGGYSVPVPMDGSYSVMFSGGGFEPFATTANVVGGRNVKVDYLAVVLAIIAGDYNGNGVVDAADYTVWRDTLGQTGTGLAADGNGDNMITALDYDVWKSHFGQTNVGGSHVAKSAAADLEMAVRRGGLPYVTSVPEPSAVLLAAFSCLWLLSFLGRARSQRC